MTGDTSSHLAETVRQALAAAPAWVRTDLTAKDASARERAEEVLAALIVAAISDAENPA